MSEKEIFVFLKERIVCIQSTKDKPTRIAINGIEGTGKTVFTKRVNKYLITEGLESIHVSIDGFHFNKEVRYQKGRNSAVGYYEDSYDEISFVEKVLKSSQSEIPHYVSSTHDLESDNYLDLDPTYIRDSSILLSDGAYLFKPNYKDHWDLKIYLKTDFETAMNRGIERDKELLGGYDAAKEKFLLRYHQASKIYLKENDPESIADIIIDNTDFNNLRLVKE